MAGWKPKSAVWYSPRAIKAPVRTVSPTVVETQIGPNSYRYDARSTLDRGNIDQGPLVSTYFTKKLSKREKKRQTRNSWREEWDESFMDDTAKHVWTPTRWSTWSYSTFLGGSLDVDNDDNLFVKAPANYLTPNSLAIKAKTNYWTSEDIIRIKELARVCYFKMIDDKDYMAEKYKDIETCGMSSSVWKQKKQMCDNVYETFIPGFTPLEQAIAINHKIRDLESAAMRRPHGSKSQGTIFEFRRSDYADADLNNQVNMNRFNERYHLDILNNISIIGDLGTEFKVEKSIGETEVHNSDTFRKKIMRTYDQMSLVDTYQRVLPNYRLKFLTKDLNINVPVATSEKKQKIIILCDYSGSMNDNTKQKWVNALLMDRFRYVMRGEAEVFFSFFVSNPDQLRFKHVKTADDVKDFWLTHSNSPGGSYTNMARIVEYVADQVKGKRLHNLDIDLSQERPEILIINDGQDEVGIDSFSYKVNAINISEYSSELKDLCVATGGKHVRIYSDSKIVSYSQEGEKVIAD